MTEEDLLKGAEEAVRRAQHYEVEGYEEQAETYWDVAERLYEDAGIDADWFDHAALAERLDGNEPPMHIFGLFPFRRVEFTYDQDPTGPVRGIVAAPEAIERLEP